MIAAAVLCGSVFVSCGTGVKSVPVKTQADSISYAYGVLMSSNLGRMIKQFPVDTVDMCKLAQAFAISQLDTNFVKSVPQTFGVDLNIEAFKFGFAVGAMGKSEMDAAAANALLNDRFMAYKNEKETKNAEEGAAFLEANKSAEGVVTLESGLQYKVLVAGEGEKPTADSKVKCHYEGRLIDGTVFDSSLERGEPTEFPVGGVIKGWTEALQLMPVGSKWEIYVPSELAYGASGAGQKIGPNSTLIFQIELIEIVK